MSISRLIAVTAAAATFATPALAAGPPSNPGHRDDNPGATKKAATTPGPSASAQSKAKAYGKACQGQSKKHVKGEKGTAFSRCVTAMAKVATDSSTSAREACASMSKKHVKGEKGTAYSRCVKAAAQVRKAQKSSSGDDATS